MSLELHAFLSSRENVNRESWQGAITMLGFPVQLDAGLDLTKDSGFSPCLLDGRESGFEICCDSVAELLDVYPTVAEAVQGKDRAISFRWGGDMREGACVTAAAAALASAFNAVVYFPDDDSICTFDQLKRDFVAYLAEPK
jgi:hypothetical protein